MTRALAQHALRLLASIVTRADEVDPPPSVTCSAAVGAMQTCSNALPCKRSRSRHKCVLSQRSFDQRGKLRLASCKVPRKRFMLTL